MDAKELTERLARLEAVMSGPHLETTRYTYTTGADVHCYSCAVTVELTRHETPERCSMWAVRDDGGYCLNTDGEMEYEPSPSSRDEAFLKRCRFPRDTALQHARAFFQKKVASEVAFLKKRL